MQNRNADLSSLRIDKSNKEEIKSSKKPLLIIAGIIIIFLVGYLLISSVIGSSIRVKLVTAVLQKPFQTSTLLNASGYVVAQRKAAVASKGTGRLIYLGVVEGDRVKKGQIIARLEDNDIRAQLDQASANLKLVEADLKEAENNYNRQKELLAKKLISQQDYESAEATYNKTLASIDVAKAQLKTSEVALENTLIRAPFDGTVLTKDADVGEIVAPFGASATSRAAVVTMADMKSLQVEADVSESNIEKIKLKQDCQIVLDAYPEKSYPGYVDKIVPTADRSKATVLVKVGFKEYDNSVLPEMSAKVSFLTDSVDPELMNQKPILIIPSTSFEENNGKAYVYKVEDGIAKQHEVSIGQRFENYVEITSGLKSGDQIIDSLNDKIKEGTKVKVSQE